MDLQLTGKRAIVSGGSSGIGLAIAKALVAEGATVALAARNPERLDAARASSGAALAVPTDTTDDASVRAMVDRVVAAFGGVDILVNTAAKPATGGAPTALAELDDDEIALDLDTKVLGYLRTARAAAPHMTARGWGRIVNVAGLNARTAAIPAASMRNAAVVALTKNLADQLGPAGVNATVVHPGITVTERTPADVATGPAGNVIRRLVTAQELADVVVFLCSPRSVAITGDVIAAGGGQPGPVFS
ncbi:MAG TPA: SDR family oxidoreductase [Rhodoglobus sp.]|nr:SDR family oxidoreductase [Rhodoglobus sp.]